VHSSGGVVVAGPLVVSSEAGSMSDSSIEIRQKLLVDSLVSLSIIRKMAFQFIDRSISSRFSASLDDRSGTVAEMQ
jgi:hypothetical protein